MQFYFKTILCRCKMCGALIVTHRVMFKHLTAALPERKIGFLSFGESGYYTA